MPIASPQCSTCSSVGWPGRMSASSCTADAACDPAPPRLPCPPTSRGAAPSSTCSARQALMTALAIAPQRRAVDRRLQFDDPLRHAHGPPRLVDVRHVAQHLGQEKGLPRAAEEAGNPPAAHVADGLEALDGVAHRVEARGRQLQGIDGANAGDEKQEAPGQAALAPLAIATALAIT